MKHIAITKGNVATVIESDGCTWAEVRAFAIKRTGEADVTVIATEDTAVEDVRIRWVGNDYDSKTSGPKRLQLREIVAGTVDVWADWRDA